MPRRPPPPATVLATLLLAWGLPACREGTSPDRLPAQRTVRDLGAPGFHQGWAFDINSAGHVVGRTLVDGQGPFSRPFVWTLATGPRDIGIPSAGNADAQAINDRGEVTGVADGRAYRWTARDGVRPLEVPEGSEYSGGNDIANDGTIVGYWVSSPDTARPALWTPSGALRTLSMPPGLVNVVAVGVNDRGEVAGYGLETDGGGMHAYHWSATGERREIVPPAGARDAMAVAIDGRGRVAGWFTDADDRRRAFVWTAEGGVRDLGTLPGTSGCQAEDIGDGGHVVGACEDRAFVWTERGGMRDLGRLAGADHRGSHALAVNRHGQAVGYSRLGNAYHAVLFVTAP